MGANRRKATTHILPRNSIGIKSYSQVGGCNDVSDRGIISVEGRKAMQELVGSCSSVTEIHVSKSVQKFVSVCSSDTEIRVSVFRKSWVCVRMILKFVYQRVFRN